MLRARPRPGCRAQTHLLRRAWPGGPEGAVVFVLGQDRLQVPKV